MVYPRERILVQILWKLMCEWYTIVPSMFADVVSHRE